MSIQILGTKLLRYSIKPITINKIKVNLYPAVTFLNKSDTLPEASEKRKVAIIKNLQGNCRIAKKYNLSQIKLERECDIKRAIHPNNVKNKTRKKLLFLLRIKSKIKTTKGKSHCISPTESRISSYGPIQWLLPLVVLILLLILKRKKSF